MAASSCRGNVFVVESSDPAAEPSQEGPRVFANFDDSAAVWIDYDAHARIIKRDSLVFGLRIRYHP